MKVKDLISILSKEDEDLDVLINIKSGGKKFVYDISTFNIEKINAACKKDFSAICLRGGGMTIGYIDHN